MYRTKSPAADHGIDTESFFTLVGHGSEASVGNCDSTLVNLFAEASEAFEDIDVFAIFGQEFQPFHLQPRRGPCLLVGKNVSAPDTTGDEVLRLLRKDVRGTGVTGTERWPANGGV